MPKLTLFMIITPPDIGIAKYSLRALKKKLPSLPDCSVMIFQNGLSEQQEREIASITYGTEWHSVSNRSKTSQIFKSEIGKNYTTDEGATALRIGLYENYDEVWSRELVRLDSPLFAMIDSDFEIFDVTFIPDMLAAFANDDKLAFFATEYSQTQEVFETYSQTRALVMERWNTWFCIYRKAALEQNHDFSYKELRDEASGLPMKYDSAAWLQKLLGERGWRGCELERLHEWKYIHYGAFSQNTTLSGTKLALYRIFRIMQHNGFRHLHRSECASKQLRRIGRIAYRWLRLQAYDAQRSRYIFDQRSPARGAKGPRLSCGAPVPERSGLIEIPSRGIQAYRTRPDLPGVTRKTRLYLQTSQRPRIGYRS